MPSTKHLFPGKYTTVLTPQSVTYGTRSWARNSFTLRYWAKYPVFVRTLTPSSLGLMPIFRKVPS